MKGSIQHVNSEDENPHESQNFNVIPTELNKSPNSQAFEENLAGENQESEAERISKINLILNPKQLIPVLNILKKLKEKSIQQ